MGKNQQRPTEESSVIFTAVLWSPLVSTDSPGASPPSLNLKPNCFHFLQKYLWLSLKQKGSSLSAEHYVKENTQTTRELSSSSVQHSWLNKTLFRPCPSSAGQRVGCYQVPRWSWARDGPAHLQWSAVPQVWPSAAWERNQSVHKAVMIDLQCAAPSGIRALSNL